MSQNRQEVKLNKFLVFFFIVYFSNMSECFLCMYVSTQCAWGAQRPGEGNGFPRASHRSLQSVLVLIKETESSTTAVNVLNYYSISPTF